MATAAEIKRALSTDARQFIYLMAVSSPDEFREQLGGRVSANATPDDMTEVVMDLIEARQYQDVFDLLTAVPVRGDMLSPEARAAVKNMAASKDGALRNETAGGNWWESVNWGDVGSGAGSIISSIICMFTDCPQSTPPPPAETNNNSNNNSNSNDKKDEDKWSTGTIIAVVVGGLAVLGLIIGGIVWAVNSGKKKD